MPGGTSARTGPVYDPATGAEQARVLLACAQDVDDAVASAVAAAAAWRTSSLSTRQKVLFAAESWSHMVDTVGAFFAGFDDDTPARLGAPAKAAA